jgi:hypothetical protein
MPSSSRGWIAHGASGRWRALLLWGDWRSPTSVADAVVAAVLLTSLTGCVIPIDGGRLVN